MLFILINDTYSLFIAKLRKHNILNIHRFVTFLKYKNYSLSNILKWLTIKYVLYVYQLSVCEYSYKYNMNFKYYGLHGTVHIIQHGLPKIKIYCMVIGEKNVMSSNLGFVVIFFPIINLWISALFSTYILLQYLFTLFSFLQQN